jgi:HEAT repeat protein
MSFWLRSDPKYTPAILNALNRWEVLPETLVSQVVSLLTSVDENIQRCAKFALIGHTLPHEILVQIVELLASRREQYPASQILASQTNLSEPIVRGIARHLDSNDPWAMVYAVRALETQTALPGEVRNKLIPLLDGHYPGLQFQAAKTLGNQEALASEVLYRMVALLDHDNQFLRECVMDTLGKNTRLPEDIVCTIIPLLEDYNSRIQEAAINTLGNQALLAANVLYRIEALLDSENYHVQIAAVRMLGNQAVLADEVLCRMLRLLEAGETMVQSAVERALRAHAASSDIVFSRLEERDLHRKSKKSITSVMGQLQQGDEYQQQDALEALGRGKILPEASTAIIAKQFLITEDLHTNTFLLRRALQTLGRPGLPKTIAQQIGRYLGSDYHHIRMAACEALLQQSELPAATITPYLATFYEALLDISWERDICWVSTPSGSQLRVDGRSIPLLGWTTRSTVKVQDIAAELHIPQLIRKRRIAKHWTKFVSRIPAMSHNSLRRQQKK